MRRGEIDGVTVLRQDLPGTPFGELSFGCNPRDEDLDTIGLTHLVQELVLWAEPYVADRHTEMSDMCETSFTAAGTPEQLAAHFTAICAALSDLPPTDLAEALLDAAPEDRYLGDVEDGLRDPWGSLLARRYGPRGPGLARWPVVDYRLFTADEIRRHVRTYFAAGNAVLTLTADPPPALRLPLPAGPRVTRTAPAVPHQAGPGWYADEVGGVGLAFRAAPGVAALILFRLLKARTDAALARAGVACLADPVYLPVDDTTHEYGLVVRLQGRKAAKHAARAAEVLWTELRRLAHDGPHQAELDREAASLEDTPQAEVRALQEELDWEERVGWLAPAMAFGQAVQLELFGTAEHYRPRPPGRLTASTARELTAGWLSTALLVVPRGVTPELPGVIAQSCPTSPVPPSGVTYRPSLLRRRGNGGALVVGTDSVAVVDGAGGVHSIPLPEALLAERDGSWWLAHTGHGCVTDISAYSGAGEALRTVLPPRRVRRYD